ncbi:MAG TPA: prepilin-type N-terminal cleavage/methylation domain-containing protein [Planctomycetota bacterium]|nr:prepilin-type N-terminal cleavage/methylation domain-containing protein [Planctomycetota bacterium]
MTATMRCKTPTSRSRAAGFSLLEVVIAMGILSIVLLGAALALKSTNDISTSGAISSDMELTNQNALSAMSTELRDSAVRVITVAGDGSAIQFQVPVDLDGNGTVLDGSGNTEYGLIDKGVPSRGTITYRFVQNEAGGTPEVLDEHVLNADVNGNIDRTDRFSIGWVQRFTQVTGQAETAGRILTDRCVVLPEAAWGSDIDGDGLADPIFALDAATGRVSIGLRTVRVTGRNNVHPSRCATTVLLRNK